MKLHYFMHSFANSRKHKHGKHIFLQILVKIYTISAHICTLVSKPVWNICFIKKQFTAETNQPFRGCKKVLKNKMLQRIKKITFDTTQKPWILLCKMHK